MHLYILSENHPDDCRVSLLCNQNLEDVLARLFNVTLLYPRLNQTIKLGSHRFSDHKIAFTRRYRQRLSKSWFDLEQLPTLGKGPNVLLIIGFTPRHLLSIHTLGPLLKRFDLRIAYLNDGFALDHIDTSVIPYLDHLFVATAEFADEINRDPRFKTLSAHFLPMGYNTFELEHPQNRWIDILSYGRRNEVLHQQLVAHSHLPSGGFGGPDRMRSGVSSGISSGVSSGIGSGSKRGPFYFYSTFSHETLLNKQDHFMLQSKLLGSSKISLCFESSDVPRFRGYSPLLYRWFEAWAYGCNVVGKRPFGRGVAELMDWPDSAIDLPDQPADWLPYLESILADQDRLAANSQRNYRECLLRHDWRYRIQSLFDTVGLPSSEILKADIRTLQERAAAVRSEPVLV
jgi:hypothetical protein